MPKLNNNSDYTKPHLDLHASLPEVLQNDTSRSVFSNLFDRYLTKQEVLQVAGYVGVGNRNAIQPRRIHEPTVHRQAFQLQPILHTKIGSIDHAASWQDIQNELSRIGVDMENYDQWGKTTQFNWVPPVDLDKLIHYQDYYWNDVDVPNSTPEYITIRSRCNTAIANANFWQSLNDEFGSTIDIFDIRVVDDLSTYQTFSVLAISASLDAITVAGDVTSDILSGQFINLMGNANNNGVFQIVAPPVYDGVGQSVLLVAPGAFTLDDITGGLLSQRKFDKIVLRGEYQRLFDPGFVFFLRESLNTELNDTFQEVTGVFYDTTLNETVLTLNTTTTDNNVTGVVSLVEQLDFYLAERDCQCTGSVGWDLLLWDDNVDNPLWDNVPGSSTDPIDHDTLITSISNVGAPVGIPATIPLWYDTAADVVFQYHNTAVFIGWKVLWNKFSLLLDRTEGFALWDFTLGCGISSVIKSADQWIDRNFWLHKTDVDNFSSVKQAQFPIIEYDWDLELNEWSYSENIWQYRLDNFSKFELSSVVPSVIELQPISLWERMTIGGVDSIVLDERYGDLTDEWGVGTKFRADTLGTIFEIASISYKTVTIGQPYNTIITITDDIATSGLLTGSLSSGRSSRTALFPFRTNNDDPWKGYGSHWLYVGQQDTVPINHQPINDENTIPASLIVVSDPIGYDYVHTYAAQQYTITTPVILDTFEFVGNVLAGSSRMLSRRSLVRSDSVRVYINDVREYGSYTELADNTVNVVGVTAISTGGVVDSWILSDDVSSEISAGDDIRVELNSGNSVNGTYRVTGVIGNVVSTDNVLTPIPNNVSPDGVVSNITTPIVDVGEVSYVRGIKFFAGFEPTRFDVVRIEVGEDTINELGLFGVPVRTTIDNADYLVAGDTVVSLIQYTQIEQVKSTSNQYPLFDIYNADSTSALRANPIFGYKTSPDAAVNPIVGLRMVADFNQRIFSFDQFILDTDGGDIYAFRDYSNVEYFYWFNPMNERLFFWDGIEWVEKTQMSLYYRKAVVSAVEPGVFEKSIDGLFWFDTVLLHLFRRNTSTSTWDLIPNVDIRSADSTIQSIWRKGLNDEQYVPAKVDWYDRTEDEYNVERDDFINQLVSNILATEPSVTTVEATSRATTDWLAKQSNPLSESGVWVGDWEIPDPLYFNHMHENRKCLTSRELLSHFSSIINAQPKLPGYNGLPEGMFHLIPTENVNYGLGGTIHEYGDSFGMLLSSVFVNNVTPLSLIEFGHDQYESLLNNIQELYRDNVFGYLVDVNNTAVLDVTSLIVDEIIKLHEGSDFLSVVYGDSTVYDETTAKGIRNWIITLPYMSLIRKALPHRIVDVEHGINQVIHHDGHRTDYFLTPATRENIINNIINAPDDRTRFPTPTDDPVDTFGKSSIALPPNTISEFGSSFNTQILGREGVYWYHVNGTERTLYRFVVAAVGPFEPASTNVDGSLWMDLSVGFEVLRYKVTDIVTGIVSWIPVPGVIIGDGRLHNGIVPSDVTTSTFSVWEVIDLDVVLGDVIFNIEQLIYDNAPSPISLKYPLDSVRDLESSAYDMHLLDSFNNHVTQSDIQTPLTNVDFSSIDPFTWNYKFSSAGVGIQLLAADAITNSFVVAGDLVAFFDPCTAVGACPSVVSFFIKNSSVNDGTWTTVQSVVGVPVAAYDILTDSTAILVQEPVTTGGVGVVYTGLLPSNSNDGSESGGDWRDYYEQVYNTPFPHLEPWKLQDYTDKPDWWDAHYLNVDDTKWGDRRWNYKHGFEIVGIDIVDDGFYVTGDFRDIYVDGNTFSLTDTPSAIYDSTFAVTPLVGISSVNIGTIGSASFVVSGNLVGVLPTGTGIAVSDSVGNLVGLFTVASVTFSGPPTFESVITVTEAIDSAVGMVNITGLTYDPIINQTKIRVIDDLTVNLFGGKLLLHFGMWERIRVGLIPPGEVYSNGVIGVTGNAILDQSVYGLRTPVVPSYNYFSVNIDNVAITGGAVTFNSDSVLPPYFDPTIHYTTAIPAFDLSVRSLFVNFSTEIVSPSADFVFGDAGPVEWEWKVASQYLYDKLTIAYKIDPVRVVTKTFGVEMYYIAGLGIDVSTNTPLAHNRISFHGEVNDSGLVAVNGTNQWYTNFNRFTGYDASYADFRRLWTTWTAPLTYQFATFVDTPSFGLAHRYVDLNEFDYAISSKRAPGVEDYWYDVFDVYVTAIPPSIRRYDNQFDWGLEINTNLPQSRSVEYYDVHNYQFYANPVTNTLTLYTWAISAVDLFNNTLSISGNQTNLFGSDSMFIISDSTGNDGTYNVKSASYDVGTGSTIIELDVSIVSAVIDGTITLSYRTIPWQTGDIVYISTTETLPLPLIESAGGGLIPYFIIVDDSINFRLATTLGNALTGTNLPIFTSGTRDHYVGELRSTFTANSGQQTDTLWRHYELDKTNVLKFSTPYDIQGMQTLVNIIDGYDVHSYDVGWRINEDNTAVDPDTGRMLGWQVEVERFIDYAFGLRRLRQQVVDKHSVTVDINTNEWIFAQPNQTWEVGDTVNVFSSTGVYPTPIAQNVTYYIIRDINNTFSLASTKSGAINRTAIDVTSIVGIGDLQIGKVRTKDFERHQEINPTRGAIWFRPSRGIISNIIDGPAPDTRTSNLIFDQNGNPIKESNLRVFREDKVTKITIINDLNDAVILKDTSPYTLLHFGGMHLFIDAYEHVLRFNNYTSDDVLIYDPFIGLNVTKFELLFNRQIEFNERPNLGGYYLQTFFNQGAELQRNIEASVEDIRFMYDTNTVLETTKITSEARRGLGYEGTRSYLDNLNLREKSQFLFWRGLIQTKGSLPAIRAFVNSRRFIDAKLDGFWAYKLAEFGAAAEKEYPELYITTEDARSNDIRIQFVDAADVCDPGYSVNVYDNESCGYAFPDTGEPVSLATPGFTPVVITDDDRWFNQPDQIATLRNNGLNMHFSLKPMDKLDAFVSDTTTFSIVSTSSSLVNGVSRMVYVVSGVANIQANDYIAIRGTNVTSENVEYIVLSSVDNGSTTTIVIDASPFVPVIAGSVILGPSNPSGWILQSRNAPTDVELLVYGLDGWISNGSWPIGDLPVLRHNFKADTLIVTVRLYADGYYKEYVVPSSQSTLSIDDYIPNVGGLRVFKRISTGDYVKLTINVDYVELLVPDGSGGTNTLSNSLIFRDPVLSTDVIKVVFVASELIESLHYNIVNANIVQLADSVLLDKTTFPALYDMAIWGLTVDESAQNPARLIDKIADTVVSTVQIWDPARGYHYTSGIHNVDLQNVNDPARYNMTPTNQSLISGQAYSIDPWVGQRVGLTWLDTSNLEYLPYYDVHVYPEIENRLRKWGELAQWSEIIIHEWVKSDIPPSEWDEIAKIEENNNSIDDSVRKSGTARKTLFELVNGDWVENKATYQDFDSVIDGILVGTDRQFNATEFQVGDVVNVYVNGVISISNYQFVSSLLITLSVNDVDRIRIIKPRITDQTIIDTGIEAGILLSEYQFVEIDKKDGFDLDVSEYYFWVTNKTTKSVGKNRTDAIIGVTNSLRTMPAPYMFFQGLKTKSTFVIEGEKTLSRMEQYVTIPGQISITTQLPLFADEDVVVTVDGVGINDITFADGNNVITFENDIQVGNQTLSVSYVGRYDEKVELPYRFSQMISRGLRGIINADRRYVLQYTRDYTLRDTLADGKTDLQLKNLHSEWEMFRLNQPYHINRILWDKITEAIIGYLLSDSSIRVPSLERELYDEKFGTSTRYGIGQGQAFVAGELALASILSDLENSEHDFRPIDINVFFDRYNFDTAAGIEEAMNIIYNTYSFEHVNRMFFSVLHDAFSTQQKYADIIKTSMISLHGIQPFVTNGIYDE